MHTAAHEGSIETAAQCLTQLQYSELVPCTLYYAYAAASRKGGSYHSVTRDSLVHQVPVPYCSSSRVIAWDFSQVSVQHKLTFTPSSLSVDKL